jgi:hypothetical protein
MRKGKLYHLIVCVTLFASSPSTRADDSEKTVKKAVERSTLNQPGTKPFHLKAVLAPTYERDLSSNRTGEVEIWWISPNQWRREVRSPDFHQVCVFNGSREWQKNEGDYFPEWLRETSVALIQPVPDLDQVLKQLGEADVKRLFGATHFSWMTMSSDGNVEKGMGAGITVTENTGLLQGGSDIGWSGYYSDYKGFHGRMVARKVSVGSPEVTAKVTILEDFRDISSNLFDASAGVGDSPPLKTLVVPEPDLRKNLLPTSQVVWPTLKDGPVEGTVTTEIVVDRTGKVREVGTIVSDNPGVSETAGKAIGSMQFKPYIQDGNPIQVVSRITMPFKTLRPAGMETFGSARNYFELARRISFPAAGNGPSYVLRATFQAKISAGTVQEGHYVDTWMNDGEWRREAIVDKSRFVRTRHGEKLFLMAEGPDAAILRLVLKEMEPIPAIDTFVESDWRIKRDAVDGLKTIRVLAGYESPSGELDPEQARGYWFDESGKLVKTHFRGLDAKRLEFSEYSGAQIAHEIRVFQNGALALLIRITEVSPAGAADEKTFELPGHEWKRVFTDEVR